MVDGSRGGEQRGASGYLVVSVKPAERVADNIENFFDNR
jgi:hypothetical protein